jgi:hypothetical protein
MSEPIKSDWDLGRPDDHLRFCLEFATSKYIRLEAEVAALQAENERLKGEERVNELGTLAPARLVRYWMEKCKQNESENERLRIQNDNLMKAWLAAKGVQP